MRYVDCKVGQRVYVGEAARDWGNSKEHNLARTTTIVAIDTAWANERTADFAHSVVVYRPELLGGYNVGINGQSYKDAYLVNPCALELLKEAKQYAPVKAYPHVCKICKAPARKISKAILCSRDGCKSKSSIKAQYKVPYVKREKFVGVDSDGYVICPACHKRVFDGNAIDWARCGNCNGVKFKHKWVVGQKLYINDQTHFLCVAEPISNASQVYRRITN